MAAPDDIDEGRRAFARREWRAAHARFTKSTAELSPDDLERAAVCAYLIGSEAEATALWRRAHHERIDRGDPEGAARAGFWISLSALLDGERSQSMGWLARTERLLQDRPDGIARGYVRALEGLFAMGSGNAAAASEHFRDAIALAVRFEEPDLLAMALLGSGQARIQMQQVAEGVRMLDEAMVTVTGSDVSPIAAGIVYCAVILTCQRTFDLRRASEWTLALDRWCAEQSDLVAFRGACLVHRSEVFQLRGRWADALAEAERACEWSAERQRSTGQALYRCAELHRLRGELERAGQAYADASRAGREPQPGMSLLRLAEGEVAAAAAAIRRVLEETRDRQGPGHGLSRAAVLGPYVEIMLAAGELAAAQAGAEELAQIAASYESAMLQAQADSAIGAVHLARGDAAGALAKLRTAWTGWDQLGAPYEAARVRVLIGCACKELGDQDTAQSHFDAAATAFEQLGAAPDCERLARHRPPPADHPTRELSARELEVLRALAAGKTNREIGAQLFISEHTVARHVSNIFDKLGVSSRTAAAAYAFEHALCGPQARRDGQF
jgi:ATP/maltotriose-dependent transcriptional regulator MalT